MTKPRFPVIDGKPPPDTPKQRMIDRHKAALHPEIISCHRCGSIEVMEVKLGVAYKNYKPVGGTKQLLCAACHRKGERVVLL